MKLREQPLLLLFLLIALAGVYQRGNNPVQRLLFRVVTIPARGSSFSANNIKPKELTTDMQSQALAEKLQLSIVESIVIRRDINPYQRQLLINKGLNDGVTTGQLAVSEGHLLGIVLEAKSTISSIRLVSDPSFRLAVLIDGLNSQAVLKGNINSLVVDRIPPAEDLAGRRVVTFGGGATVASVPVGILTSELQVADQLVLKRYQIDRSLREEFSTSVFIIKGSR